MTSVRLVVVGLVVGVVVGCGGTHSKRAADAGPGEDAAPSDDAGGGGDAGSFCTWATSGESCQPLSPRDLFDIDALQALTLDDLAWEMTGTETYEGVTVVRGSFSAGSWDAYDAAGDPQTIQLHYVAAAFLPPDWPQPDDPPYAYVSSVHYEDNLLQPIAGRIATYFRVPVLHIAQLPRDWLGLGFVERSTLNQASGPNVITNNPCLPVDMARGHFGVAMAQADMRAITLVQRLAEEQGGRVDRVAFRGFSKEGSAGWLLSVVDPRVEVAALGGFHNQHTLAAAAIERASWGCWGDPNEADPEGPQTGISSDWRQNTPAGAAWMNLYSVHYNKALLRPRFILLDGDVGMGTMHDGLYFALGAETPFLDELTEVPWRYVRKATQNGGATADDGDAVSKAVVPGLLVENLVRGAGSEDAVYPKVQTETASMDGDVLNVEATASATTESMVLWWSWSEDRVWNDPGQAEWTEVAMTESGGTWTSPPVDVPPGTVVGWYVEARNTVQIGATEFTRTDAAPVRFERETADIQCSPEIPAWCAGVAP